jgi:hypothetical protein
MEVKKGLALLSRKLAAAGYPSDAHVSCLICNETDWLAVIDALIDSSASS